MSNTTTTTVSDSSFFNALVTNSFIMTVVTLIFLILRTRCPKVYSPRFKHLDSSKVCERPYPLSSGWFVWLKDLYSMSEGDFLRFAGYDSVVLLRFIKGNIKVFAAAWIYGFIILIPIDATGDNIENPGTLESWSMSNVKSKSGRLWAHLIGLYILSIYTCIVLRDQYVSYLTLRVKYHRQQYPQNLTLLMTGIPFSMHANMKQVVMERLGPLRNNVVDVQIGQFTDQLDAVLVERTKMLLGLELAYYTIQERTKKKKGNRLIELVGETATDQTLLGLENKQASYSTLGIVEPQVKRPVHRIDGCLCCGGECVDAETFFEGRLASTNTIFQELRAQAEQRPVIKSFAFVFFNSYQSKSMSQQSMYSLKPHEWEVAEITPEPRDVIWSNLTWSFAHRAVREIVITVLVVTLCFFYMIPIGFVQSLANINNLANSVHFLKPIVDAAPTISSFISGFLPPLVLTIFLSMLPALLTFMSRLQGALSNSEATWSALQKMCYFQFINVFLASILSGALLNQAKAIIDNPTSIVGLLAVSVPATGLFFTTYVLLQMTSWPMSMLQVGSLIGIWFKQKFLAHTPRQYKAAEAPSQLGYVVTLSSFILMSLLGIVYSIVFPFIAVFVFLYFMLAYFVIKYQVVYVYLPNFESGGRFWPQVFGWCVVALVVAQLTLLGVFSLKLAPVQAALVVPLLLATIAFYFYCSSYYYKRSKVLVILEAETPAEVAPTDAYAQPALTAELEVTLDKNQPWD